MIYISTSLYNIERAKQIIKRFNDNDIKITYDWTSHGRITDIKKLKACAINEYNGIVNAKCLFFIVPGRYGSHIELGIAIGLKKPIVILKEEECELQPFYLLDGVTVFKMEDDAINFTIDLLRK